MRRRRDIPIEPSGEDVDLGDLVDEVAGSSVPPLDDDPDPKIAPNIRFHLITALAAVMRAIRLQSLADGLMAAIEYRAKAAALGPAAKLGETRVEKLDKRIETLNDLIDGAYKILGSWASRTWWDTRRKLIFWGILLVADTGTIAGIAYSVGDPLYLAIPLGLGVGASAITLGLLAADHRRHRERARRAHRQPKNISDDYIGFFAPDVKGSRLQAVFAGSLIVLLAGVVTLRISSSGDVLMGIGFGLVATASFLASWVSTWNHTCEISDYFDSLERKLDSLTAKQDPQVRIIGAHDAAKRRARILEEIGRKTGKAGAQAAKGRIYARGPMENPAVYGHGTARQPGLATTNGHVHKAKPADLADFEG